jgi:hypothetical protein
MGRSEFVCQVIVGLPLQNLSAFSRLLKGGSGLVAELQMRIDDGICATTPPSPDWAPLP